MNSDNWRRSTYARTAARWRLSCHSISSTNLFDSLSLKSLTFFFARKCRPARTCIYKPVALLCQEFFSEQPNACASITLVVISHHLGCLLILASELLTLKLHPHISSFMSGRARIPRHQTLGERRILNEVKLLTAYIGQGFLIL